MDRTTTPMTMDPLTIILAVVRLLTLRRREARISRRRASNSFILLLQMALGKLLRYSFDLYENDSTHESEWSNDMYTL